MYHEIGDGPNSLYVRDKEFSEQMKYLWENNYRVVTLSEGLRMLKAKENMSKVIAITFDDGYLSFYSKVWPILREYNFPATVFVITKNCDNHLYLNWEQLKFLQANWIEIGSHTQTHPALTQISHAAIVDEVVGSKAILDKNLVYPCQEFCYPTGVYNKEVVEVVNEAGYEVAVTVNYAKATRNNEDLLMPRIRIPRGISLQGFANSI